MGRFVLLVGVIQFCWLGVSWGYTGCHSSGPPSYHGQKGWKCSKTRKKCSDGGTHWRCTKTKKSSSKKKTKRKKKKKSGMRAFTTKGMNTICRPGHSKADVTSYVAKGGNLIWSNKFSSTKYAQPSMYKALLYAAQTNTVRVGNISLKKGGLLKFRDGKKRSGACGGGYAHCTHQCGIDADVNGNGEAGTFAVFKRMSRGAYLYGCFYKRSKGLSYVIADPSGHGSHGHCRIK